jgi:phospholipase/carboxylesterase
MGAAVPEHFAAVFPDGLHPFEVRRPERKVRIGRAWYLYNPDDRPAFFASLQASSEALWQLIETAADALGADKSQVWMAGFSQGAYMTHYTALRHLDQVPGWVSQAGGFREEYGGSPFPDASGHQVLLQHGTQDEAIGVEVAEATASILQKHGASVTTQLFDAGHVIRPEMADDVRTWLEEHCPPQ